MYIVSRFIGNKFKLCNLIFHIKCNIKDTLNSNQVLNKTYYLNLWYSPNTTSNCMEAIVKDIDSK